MTAALPLALIACGFAGDGAPDPLIKPGDRVAFVGGSFWEEERRSGAIETALTLAVPDVTFRHLGWAGDMADQSARRYFGSAADGRQHLLEHVDLVRPTVIFVAYGGAEALPGGMSPEDFESHLNSLLDELASRTDRVILAGPQPPRPGADGGPSREPPEFPLYQQAVIRTALTRGLPFILTTDWKRAGLTPGWDGRFGVRLRRRPIGVAELFLTWCGLPTKWAAPPAPPALPDAPSELERDAGAVGALLYAARAAAARSSAAKRRPLYGELRELIRAKSELFLHRHRPQNETYLRGFRAHEQGNNAVEIEKFEPLVAAKDAEIQRLRDQLVKDAPQ